MQQGLSELAKRLLETTFSRECDPQTLKSLRQCGEKLVNTVSEAPIYSAGGTSRSNTCPQIISLLKGRSQESGVHRNVTSSCLSS